MKISRLTIENFRGHAKTDLLIADHHALVGENGSRKTAILEAINFATSPYYISSRLEEQDFHNEDAGDIKITLEFDSPFVRLVPDGYQQRMILSRSVELNVKRRDKAAPRKAFCDPFVVSHLCKPIIYGSKKEILGLTLPETVTLNDLPDAISGTDQGVIIPRKSGKEMSIRRETLSLTDETIGFPDVFYFDRQRERETKVGFNSLFSKIAKDLNWRYRKGWSQNEAIAAWDSYYQGVISIVEDRKKREILEPVRKLMCEFLGEDCSALEISLLNIEEPFSKGFLSFRRDSNQIDLPGAGSGISMLAALILLEYVSTLTGGEMILLIDEPEIHLHPQLQVRLAQHLKQLSFQSVITTHSPLFANLGEWRSITRMTRSESFPQTETLAQTVGGQTVTGHLDDIRKFYYHETTFTSDDNELFFAKKVLLVEGPVDKYGLPRLARLMGVKFDQLTIVSCNGKEKIPHYAMVCRAYAIPAFVLFDFDGKGVADEQNARVLDLCKDISVGYFETSFEELLGIGTNASHKASNTLRCIDEIKTASEIPAEIAKVIREISNWCSSESV